MLGGGQGRLGANAECTPQVTVGSHAISLGRAAAVIPTHTIGGCKYDFLRSDPDSLALLGPQLRESSNIERCSAEMARASDPASDMCFWSVRIV